jgi:hypothetical protein
MMFGLLPEEADDWLPAISMYQPYASLMFVDDPAYRKEHETRGRPYPAKYEGRRIAFQAGLSLPSHVPADLDELAKRAFGSDWRRTLPRGAYIGTAVLTGCFPTGNMVEHIGFADRVAGIWDAGRFAWELGGRQSITPPIPAKGKQGWWKARADLFPCDSEERRQAETRHAAQGEARPNGSCSEIAQTEHPTSATGEREGE